MYPNQRYSESIQTFPTSALLPVCGDNLPSTKVCVCIWVHACELQSACLQISLSLPTLSKDLMKRIDPDQARFWSDQINECKRECH